MHPSAPIHLSGPSHLSEPIHPGIALRLSAALRPSAAKRTSAALRPSAAKRTSAALRTPAEQDLALRHLDKLRRDAQGYLKALLQLGLTRCYELMLECECSFQLSVNGSVRNGYSRKTITSAVGLLTLKVPRLRAPGGVFSSRLLTKYRTRVAPELEQQVLRLCAYDLHYADPDVLRSLLLELWGRPYRELEDAQLQPLLQTVVSALLDWHSRPLAPRYVAVFNVRWDSSQEQLELPAHELIWDQHQAPRLAALQTAYRRAHAYYFTCGITAQGTCELLELYRPDTTRYPLVLTQQEQAIYDEVAQEWATCRPEFWLRLSERLSYDLRALEQAIAQHMLEQLRARGVEDVILFLGPHLPLSPDLVQAYFPFATIY